MNIKYLFLSMLFLLVGCNSKADSLTGAPISDRPEVAGEWQVTLVQPNGESLLDAILLLEQDDSSLTGIWQWPLGDREIEGHLEGDNIFFHFWFEDEGRQVQNAFKGQASSEHMEGTMEFLKEDGTTVFTLTWSAQPVTAAGLPSHEQLVPIVDIATQPPLELAARFEAALNVLFERENVPGIVAAYYYSDERSAVFATGFSDVEANTPMPVQARMPAGSVGKTIVSALILNLAAEELIRLDEPISKWLGDEHWFSRLPNHDALTVRMLLNHSGGIIDHVHDSAYIGAINDLSQAEKLDRDFAFLPEELVAFALDKEPLFPPGEGFNYSDTGYILLGMVIEQATQKPFYELVGQRFLTPFQLSNIVPADRRDIPALVPGYLAEDNPLGLPAKTVSEGVMLFNPATEWTGGGFVANAGDLARWAWLLYGGTAVSAPYLEEMLQSTSPNNTRYGLGVSVGETPWGLAYGHSGTFPGYTSRILYFPEHQLGIAVQVNSDIAVDAFQLTLDLAEGILLSSTSDTED